MCPASQARKGGGGPWRSSFRPAPSPRPAPRARTAARRPPRRRPRGGRPGTRTRLRAPRRPAMGFPVLCHEIAFCGTGPALSPVPRRLPIRPTRQNGPHPPQEPPALHPRWHDDAGVAPPPAARAARARVPQTAFSWQKSNYSIARPAVPSWEAVLDAPRGRRLPPPPAALPPSRSPQVGQITDFVPSTLRHLGRTFHLSA